MARRGREASARFGRIVRDAFAELLDQRTPFGRLALTQVLATAGDTLLTVSLAGSLFFSISPAAAKDKVILYLVLTMAPFAVVAPLLGPVIDRSSGARRAMVVLSALGRAVVCVFMARDVHSLLLFPEAFAMLVLSKVYLVTRGAIVPLLAQRTPTRPGQPDAPFPRYQELATLNAHLGLLSSLAGFAAALPAIAVLKLFGAAWVLRLDVLVFLAAAWSGVRLPIARRRRLDAQGPAVSDFADGRPAAGAGPAGAGAGAGADAPGSTAGAAWQAPPRGKSALVLLGGRHAVHPEVTLALSAMSLLRGVFGFMTFLLAFDLRRMHAPTWWYGGVLAATLAGTVVGVLLVPRARRVLVEQQMLAVTVWMVAVLGVVAAVVGGIGVQVALGFVLGVAAAAAKPAFDALVQRYVPVAEQGRAFARFETRLQLAWVVGSLIPVVTALPLGAGDVVIAVMAGVVAISYATGRRALDLRSGPRREPGAPGAPGDPGASPAPGHP